MYLRYSILLSIFFLSSLTLQAPLSTFSNRRENSGSCATKIVQPMPIDPREDKDKNMNYFGFIDATKELCHRVTHMGDRNARARVAMERKLTLILKRQDKNNLESGPRVYLPDGNPGEIECKIFTYCFDMSVENHHVHVVTEHLCIEYINNITRTDVLNCRDKDGKNTRGGTFKLAWPEVTYHAYVTQDYDAKNDELFPKQDE
ncbi:hypothetical protein P154DRAFT_576042 [Amniculicola lignicola CBS 123094]|uniref:Uncharacterized protein n=1 Tax=Amniculicola lignicola CBS 123094 TaxID=1392246 RepID=A0A6A5WFG8_9PLEO|nr:hypothetical protein P154DRAFT_576042 [Amniculicola lignicola CBS 123094]